MKNRTLHPITAASVVVALVLGLLTGEDAATSDCDRGVFRHGRWHVEGTGGAPADLAGFEISTVEGVTQVRAPAAHLRRACALVRRGELLLPLGDAAPLRRARRAHRADLPRLLPSRLVRPACERDTAVDDIYEAEAIRTVVRGLPGRDGPGVTVMLELTPGRLDVAGYAAAPESHLEVWCTTDPSRCVTDR